MDLNKKLKRLKENRKFVLSEFTVEDVLYRESMVSVLRQWSELWDRMRSKLVASAMAQK